ncbi:hypothetical protein OsI_21661 [Oryza sativa Indica Group]|uniref:F-box domain-containing protein n=1 Tax=Oryza sativa subsp. indica TaxID=39946 RepID=A2Y9C0_ORYSI|nr:hypothetical protein OsI_21661 [Oryza sativa Indica Group]
MAAGAEDDRLSDLPDDLLRRILHFVPFREAASTSLLSRRWGSLWRSSGAVNLVEHVEDEEDFDFDDEEDDDEVTAEEPSARRRDAFLRAAGAALTAADGDISCDHVTRLSVDVDGPDGYCITNFLDCDESAAAYDIFTGMDVLHTVVSHPAARLVEELCLRVASESDSYGVHRRRRDKEEEPSTDLGVYGLSLASLPFEKLRVLDIAGCNNLSLPPPPAAAAAAAAFPRLQTLRLRRCAAKVTHLQRLIDAAPGLATAHLESVVFNTDDNNDNQSYNHRDTGACSSISLRCPAATSLALEWCSSTDYKFYYAHSRYSDDDDSCGGSIAIDAPKLRSFRYKGLPRPFHLKSPAPETTTTTTAVSLHFNSDYYLKEDTARVHSWRFIGNFTNAKTLKLKVDNLDHLAVADKASRSKLLCVLPNLVSVELEAAQLMNTKKSAVAIANLLRCCPVLSEFTMKLNSATTCTDRYWPNHRGRFQPDFYDSVDHFMRRKSNTTTAISSIDSRKGDGDRHVDEVPDIPALSRRSFTCLQRSLKKVSLKFKWSGDDCFGVQLVKFFAQNAMVLEEMRIDSGDRKLCDHMNLNVERWVGADSTKISLKRKNFANSTWEFSRTCPDSTPELETSTTSFIVLPLER